MTPGALKDLIDPVQRTAIRDCLQREVVVELVAAFWQDLPGQLAELLVALEGSDRDGVDRVLHTLKGSGGSLGYVGIADAAQAVRNTMRAGAPLFPALERLRGVLRQSAIDDPDIDDPGLAGRLDVAWEGMPASV